MADGVKWKVEGFDELEKKLLKMSEDFGPTKGAKILIKGAKLAMQPVGEMMRSYAPYDSNNHKTDHLRDSIKVTARLVNEKDKRSAYYDSNDIVVGEVSVYTDKRGISQEFGNARVSAKPYLRISLETQVDKVLRILGTYLAFELDKYGDKT